MRRTNRGGDRERRMRVQLLGVVGALIAAVGFPYTHAQDEQAPLRAYGFDTPPQPSDKAVPAPPTRNLRPNED